MSKKDPFFLSQSNKRGLIIFLVICLIVVFFPRMILWLSPKTSYLITSKELDRLVESRERFDSKRSFVHFFESKKSHFRSPPSRFDPNTYSIEDWKNLGLSEKQSAVVLRFCSRGIYSNDQLRKIFVIPEKLYDLIKDSTYYPSKTFVNFERNSEHSEKAIEKLILVDLNKADEAELDKIPGVGSFYAKNIINYRNRLGGYVRKEQLLEVWKMDPAKYEEIQRFVTVGASIEKINLNEVSAEVLRKHPYLNWNIANSIVKLRKQKNLFSAIEDIKESVLIDEELFEKIKPYITL
jgi:DNA uptake protein ComE-like DNA-binding protein